MVYDFSPSNFEMHKKLTAILPEYVQWWLVWGFGGSSNLWSTTVPSNGPIVRSSIAVT